MWPWAISSLPGQKAVGKEVLEEEKQKKINLKEREQEEKNLKEREQEEKILKEREQEERNLKEREQEERNLKEREHIVNTNKFYEYNLLIYNFLLLMKKCKHII